MKRERVERLEIGDWDSKYVLKELEIWLVGNGI